MSGLSVMETGVLRDIAGGRRVFGPDCAETARVLRNRGFLDAGGDLTPRGREVVERP